MVRQQDNSSSLCLIFSEGKPRRAGVLEVVNLLPILVELEGEFLVSSLGARRR